MLAEASICKQLHAPEDEAATLWRVLAPVVAGQPRVRESRDGGRSYPTRWETKLTDRRPSVPAAVRLYGVDGTLRCLVADFDISRGGRDQVDRDAAAFEDLVARCGGRTFADVSPAGGRHVYMPLAEPVGFTEARHVARALAALYPSLDATPLLNLAAGCIRPPGSTHKTGGHQRLETPLSRAVAIAHRPNPPTVWRELATVLGPYLLPDEPAAEDDLEEATSAAEPPRLSAAMCRIAREGVHNYRSDSEARQAVLTAATAAGWRFGDVIRRVETGAWPGLAAFYARYSPTHRRAALVRDWRKAQAFIAFQSPVHKCTTSAPPSHGGKPVADDVHKTEHRFVRGWRTALHNLEGRRYGNRRDGITKRFLLRALAEAAHKRADRYIAFGTRSLALAAGVDHSTVARHLRDLADEPDPFIVLIEDDRGLQGDLYELRIPAEAAELATRRDYPAGKAYALRPAFRELGPVPALAYEVLERSAVVMSRFDVAASAGVSPAAAAAALRVLGEFGLATRTPSGWRLGAASLTALAERLGVLEVIAAIQQRYAQERAAWRALLGAVQITVADIVAAADESSPDPPETAITLLERVLGAYVIATT